MFFSCEKNRDLWDFVVNLLKKLLSRHQLSFRDIHCGFIGKSFTSNLANYLCVLGMSTIYNATISLLKGERRQIFSFRNLYVARLKSRIYKEFTWHLQQGCVEEFEKVWCVLDAVCNVQDNHLVFSRSVSFF